jgi:exosortase A-associated hydrolase 2
LSDVELHAAFIGSGPRRLFLLMHLPARARSAGCVLLVPPFAEEMNKSRRMLALAAQGLAARGFCAALADLHGTGDSAGEFHESTWERWKADLRAVAGHLHAQGHPVTAVLGVRTGCALAAEVAKEEGWQLTRTVFWQPVLDGARYFTQFLRLRVAASLMENDRRESAGDLRARLRAGETLEVAGYAISPAMADQLERVSLGAALGPGLGRIAWFEIVRGEDPQLPGAAAAAVAAAAAQVSIEATPVPGEPFWSATEIVQIPALIQRTVAALAG